MWPLNYFEIAKYITQKNPCQNDELHNIKIYGICSDSRKLEEFSKKFSQVDSYDHIPILFIAIKGENFDGHKYLHDVFAKGVSLALVDQNSSFIKDLKPEYLKRCLKVENVQIALRHFAAEFRKSFKFPVIAIGGSNGKTTTKELLSSFLSHSDHKITKTQKSENGFLGVAFTLLQKDHTKYNPPHALVLEIGIDETGAMQQHIDLAKPDLALLTALGPEHLTGLKTWENAVKEELILFLTPNCKRVWQLCDSKLREYFLNHIQNIEFIKSLANDMLVLEEPIDCHTSKTEQSLHAEKEFDVILKFAEKNKLNTILWSLKSLSYQSSSLIIRNPQQTLFDDIIPLSGKHNAQNFALAFGAAIHLGHTPKNILKGFKKFLAPPQRSKILRLPFDTIVFDDTYNASPMSMNAALELFKHPDWQEKPKILILGDMLELEDESKFWHESLLTPLSELHNAHLCLFGPAMYNCYRLLKEARGEERPEQNGEVLLEWSNDTNEPSLLLEKIKPHLKGSVILVKGSRGLRLERFVQCVENFFS